MSKRCDKDEEEYLSVPEGSCFFVLDIKSDLRRDTDIERKGELFPYCFPMYIRKNHFGYLPWDF